MNAKEQLRATVEDARSKLRRRQMKVAEIKSLVSALDDGRFAPRTPEWALLEAAKRLAQQVDDDTELYY